MKHAQDVSTDTEQDETEKRELERIENLAKDDSSYQLLFLCKKGEWSDVRHLISTQITPDFITSDTVITASIESEGGLFNHPKFLSNPSLERVQYLTKLNVYLSRRDTIL